MVIRATIGVFLFSLFLINCGATLPAEELAYNYDVSNSSTLTTALYLKSGQILSGISRDQIATATPGGVVIVLPGKSQVNPMLSFNKRDMELFLIDLENKLIDLKLFTKVINTVNTNAFDSFDVKINLNFLKTQYLPEKGNRIKLDVKMEIIDEEGDAETIQYQIDPDTSAKADWFNSLHDSKQFVSNKLMEKIIKDIDRWLSKKHLSKGNN